MALKPVLIDTGPLVAYLDGTDAQHVPVATFLDTFAGSLCTTGSVITEAMHLLKHDDRGPRRLAEFVEAARIQVFEFNRPQQLLAAVTLMEKYSNLPMDFADATLVLLGDRLSIYQIVTLDRRGFRTFRAGNGKPFEVLPRK